MHMKHPVCTFITSIWLFNTSWWNKLCY